jgi:hypothetical protein
MNKCRACKHLDLTQRTRSGLCICTNTSRKTYSRWGGSQTFSQLKAPSANACKTGFEQREKGIDEILGGGE